MPSDVIQFREDREAVEYLRERGINPNEFGREAFEAALRRLRAREAMDRLGEVGARLPKPVEELVREDREAR